MWKETVLHNAAAWRSEGTSYIKFQVDNGGDVKIKGIMGLRPVDMILEDVYATSKCECQSELTLDY